MAARPSWKGFLRLSLISIPVRAYTALSAAESFGLHQLHDKCHSRINYKRFCPLHGEVPYSDIVKGYEYEKDKYVVIAPEELAAIHSESDSSIAIDTFIDANAIDSMYLEKSYYLVPDGAMSQGAFAVFRQALEERQRVAVAEIVLSDREQTVLLRPLGRLLVMATLRYHAEVKELSEFEGQAQEVVIKRDEVKLMESLIDAKTSKKFDFSRYEDQYAKRMAELINAKIEGKEIVANPSHESPPVINLMEALKASLNAKTGNQAKPPKQKLARTRQAAKHPPRKKSG